MSYVSKISVAEMGAIAEVYKIQIGDNTYRYAAYTKNIEFQGEIYIAAPIKRTSFSVDKELQIIQLTLVAPLSPEIIAYVANTPVEPTNIDIWRVFADELTSYRKIFSGALRTVKFKDKVASISCEGISGRLRGKLPRFLYQTFCNYSLFDGYCALNSADYKVSAVVTVSGETLVSATFAEYADNYFRDGIVKVGTDARLITAHTTDTITIQFPFDTRLVTGGTVNAWPGCDKAPETCRDKFANILRFGGFPYIPNHNPVMSGVL